MRESLKRIMVVLRVIAVATSLLVSTSATAFAHVTAQIDGGAPGEYGLITLRVPTESDTARTTKVEVRIPDDVHFASVLVEPQPGWRVDLLKQHVAPVTHHGVEVSEGIVSVIWTATGAGIAPGEFGRFVVMAGPLPNTAALSLPTVQTYSDGTAVAWNQQAIGGAQPERPAPTVSLVAAGEPTTAPDSNDAVSWIAVVLAAIAFAIAAFAAVRAVRLTGTSRSG